MCNDVAKIKEQNVPQDFGSKFYVLMELGEKERAKDLLFNSILARNDIFNIDASMWTKKDKLGFVIKGYEKFFEELGIQIPEIKEEAKK